MRSVLFVVLATGTAGLLPAADGPFKAPPVWKPLFSGVELTDLIGDTPRLMKGHAVRIDLKAAGIGFLATPGNGDRPGETDGLKTSTFLKRHKLQLAINAAPFGPIHKDEEKEQDVVGVQVSGGKLVSPAQPGYPALLLAKDNRARIAAPPFDLEGIENAVGGFHIVLKGGEVLTGDKSIHPRTAAGVSADGKTLVLLVIDGRQKDFSDGATTAEVGEWLKALGCAEGINLDGGGTTTLVVAGADGAPKLINRPIHANKSGTERVSASHLGVFAKPLPQK
ncbi:hypothetical protein GobsT_45280 [Gemmata obscuriglobus]|uniref:Phosphodiester glycosidase domain-containing protein n=1 Tax=Gemmata obscuriglobus TaxID=114 RepID=A0A2Z3H8W3_9BACT|nr:phosphodiester glycosidase family protein [Gemmata obscuriglobus]AWM37500.1 hypothetical protein C1280_11050 [Gemmata obscuriglobus]QEG29730.1 hypothetical protein GobsT_45280 [Gemmata obscuriglobus]VTS09047.1 Uncharacterized protein OS=Isosphaera pallida (strain ATCC 43644 / DSM 9630 / IS1B) GN=Isop_2217 PE=4 SV=1: DUF2233 [Gemmata obscuriglobus UQM 2246]